MKASITSAKTATTVSWVALVTRESPLAGIVTNINDNKILSKKQQVRQQDAYPVKRGAVTTMCNTPF